MFSLTCLSLASLLITELSNRYFAISEFCCLGPGHVRHMRNYFRFFTWQFLHRSMSHCWANVFFLQLMAIFGNIGNFQVICIYLGTSLLAPIPRLIIFRDRWEYRVSGISATVAGLIYFYASREQNVWVTALVAANLIYELVRCYLDPRSKIMYDAHIIGAVIGVVCFKIGI